MTKRATFFILIFLFLSISALFAQKGIRVVGKRPPAEQLDEAKDLIKVGRYLEAVGVLYRKKSCCRDNGRGDALWG